jgi:hypothetical protein
LYRIYIGLQLSGLQRKFNNYQKVQKMGWFMRMRLRLLPVVNVDKAKEEILACIGYISSQEVAHLISTSADFYEDFASLDHIEEKLSFYGFFGRIAERRGQFEIWKRVGCLLVSFLVDVANKWSKMAGPRPASCIVRTGRNTWRKYNLIMIRTIAEKMQKDDKVLCIKTDDIYPKF